MMAGPGGRRAASPTFSIDAQVALARTSRANARGGGPYTDEEIERGLDAVAICSGNTRRAAALLKRQGLPIPRSTLRSWAAELHAYRYQQIHHERLPAIYERIAERSEALAEDAADLEDQLLRQVKANAKGLRADQAAGALRNVSVAKAVNIDKASVIRGRPTEITAHADVSELLKGLTARFGSVVSIEGQAIERASESDERSSSS
jgi:hypothetical protein